MNLNWEQRRKLFLSLGTQEYEKPPQLPSCEVVLDFGRNKLTEAENDVVPVGSSMTFVYSDNTLFVCGMPIPKKGFENM